jgi:2-C-methyl-D-erythritol 4-phosphate cytidylyltransferase
MRTVAVVLAAGSGLRFGAASPKQLRVLAGRNLIEHCVAAFAAAPAVDEIVVVVTEQMVAAVRRELAGYGKVSAVIAGGATRTDSTRAAITWLSNRMSDAKALFHDAARPLVDQRTISDCVTALDRWQAVGVVVPSSDTIVEVADGQIRRVLTRQSLARCQTPQGFLLSVIAAAYARADADPEFGAIPATDDCGVVLRYLPEVPVAVVEGSEQNLKITYPADLTVAEALLNHADDPD